MSETTGRSPDRAGDTGHAAASQPGASIGEAARRAIDKQARIELHAPAEHIARLVPPQVGIIDALAEHTTLLTTGADELDLLDFHIGLLGVDFRVLEPDELRVRILETADRLRASATAAHR